MASLSASQLATHGASAITEALRHRESIGISIRGEPRYVAMSLGRYRQLLDCELAAALADARAARAGGRFVIASPQDHLERLARLP